MSILGVIRVADRVTTSGAFVALCDMCVFGFKDLGLS